MWILCIYVRLKQITEKTKIEEREQHNRKQHKTTGEKTNMSREERREAKEL